MHHYIGKALRIDHACKPKLYTQIYESAEITSASYILDLIFAAEIATFGLVLNSPAVVIGAMLISPLMGPIMASGLAFAAADVYLGIKAFLSLVGSIVGAVAFSAILVWLLPFQAPTSEILARTQPNLLDLGVAVFLDIPCYFENEGDDAGSSLEDVYKNTRKALEKKYIVTPKTSALRLLSNSNQSRGTYVHVDVVPGRFTDDKKEDCYLHVSNGDKSRLKTNLDIQIAGSGANWELRRFRPRSLCRSRD